MNISPISEQNFHLIQPKISMDIIGKVIPNFDGTVWTYTTTQLDKPYSRTIPTSKPKTMDEITDTRYGYVAMVDGEYVGHTIVRKAFNNTLYIEDFDISENHRRKGYSKAMMDRIVDDAKKAYKGISLEVQDTNVIAFSFYIKYGFVIGGYDSLFYEKTVQNGDGAVFLYLFF